MTCDACHGGDPYATDERKAHGTGITCSHREGDVSFYIDSQKRA